MIVEFFGDVLCPWCFIGRRRLQAAIAGIPDAQVVWRSRELGQTNATPEGTALEMLREMWGQAADARAGRIRDLGRAEGLELHLDRARPVRSFDAHRLIHLAADHGRGDAALERLLFGYHTEGRNIADRATLMELGYDAGLAAPILEAMLAGDAYAASVRADYGRSEELGVSGVPTLVLEGRRLVPGIQEPEVLRGEIRGRA